MKIAIVQNQVIWGNKPRNNAYYRKVFTGLASDIDLVILCEMCDTGFIMKPERIDHISTEEVEKQYKNWADEFSIAVMGSSPVKLNDGSFRNRAFLALPGEKTVQYYDKVHLFSPTGESRKYTSGKTVPFFSLGKIKMRVLICYDLRFPYVSFSKEPYDLLIYVANWPESRLSHWNALLRARAIENQVYTIGVNRIGQDENGLYYPGHSQVIDYSGKIVCNLESQEGVGIFECDFIAQEKYRKQLPFKNDIVVL